MGSVRPEPGGRLCGSVAYQDEVQTVLKFRYGLYGNEPKKMPWFDDFGAMRFEARAIYRRHQKGIDYLNTLLENEVGENGA